ncbi:Transcriptional regulator containing GAF, AAA-type ATPase, and DNA-binding Fis domains [Chitinophaga sp. CF118]|uniref:sigma-54 interaction domain-containing protein n=1 Tax=Chitinophaga sp. CF118 TaxID=1884367 RepID=UPI0008EA67EC|nr:sigma 54-interacting transcriptional regulator [Chitinophaga sp. CF118]SFD75882.1 Transcriptional regulator containing GAF, AAA-type ATPase, and DNA-binding Fis domains [Chitinophaga sp. CF118]
MKRTRKDTPNKSQESTTINVDNAITPAGSRKQLMSNIKKELKRIISFDSSYVLVYTEGYIHYSCFTENMHPLIKNALHKNTFLSQAPLKQSIPFIIKYNNANEVLSSNIPLSLLHKENGFKSTCIIPLKVMDILIGFLAVDSFDEDHFTPLHTGMFEQLAATFSLQLCNVLLHEKLLIAKNNQDPYQEEETSEIYHFEEIIGRSKSLQEVFRNINLVSRTDTTVLLLGETGTGKELIAKAIHNLSTRKTKPLIRLNCAALPAQLIESELFGHERGAFTGAIDKRIGKFEVADGSTLFLDEIGELPLELQAKLLRVLQEKEIERLGSNKVIKINVRIIAATNRNLEQEVAAGRFRSDLYFRINVFPVQIPPLRERKEDLPLLAAHFLKKMEKKLDREFRGISNQVLQQLTDYEWPGNIRELEHMIERSAIVSRGNFIQELNIPAGTQSKPSPTTPDFTLKTWEEHEKEYILYVLMKCNGRVSGARGAAQVLNIPPTTLESKMKKFGIKKQHYLPDNPGTIE